ncbi:helix-turn-helix domain-containing protein [Kolteria novifilia]|uniref:helix-turn-helix domain-containing protein n=1 Tax=Kolteria novifilia TaxID=2527975 RepID=UPI003AF360BD
MNLPEELSPRQFAALSGLSTVTVYRYLRSGKLPARQPFGPRGRWLIPKDALDRLDEQRGEETRSAAKTQASLPSNTESATRLSGPTPKWRKARPDRDRM